MPRLPDQDEAEVLIALGAALTLFALFFLTALDADIELRKNVVYILLGLIAPVAAHQAIKQR